MIYNKSSHPVEVKKISIRLWSLRDEIEAAIGRRIKECEAAGIPLYIEDIKNFYHFNKPSELPEQSNVVELQPKETPNDMNALMEEMGLEDSENAENQESKDPEAENKNEEKTASEETAEPGTTEATPGSENLAKAEEIIAEQKEQGLETAKPNPILERPYQRQAPDSDKISYGFILLSDINMETMLSFTKDRFLQGQTVTVEFLIPKTFVMTANVSYCHNYSMRSRIISNSKLDFRIQCRFTFDLSGERDNLRNFLKSIEPTIPGAKNGT